MIENERNLIDYKFLTVASIVGLLNSFFYSNFSVMLLLLVFEIVTLLFCMYNKDWVGYLNFYLIFLCFSLESATYVGSDVFYGFKNFRIAGLNVAVWMLFPLLIKALLDFQWQRKNPSPLIRKLLFRLFLFTILGVFWGGINYLLDDNGFASKEGSIGIFINILYTFSLPIIQIIAISWVVLTNQNKTYDIKKSLFSVIVALAIVFIFCLAFGNYGNRGGLRSLQVSEVYFVTVVAVVMIVYPQIDLKSKCILAISGLTILILSLTFNTNGKIIITAFLIPVVMLLIAGKLGVKIRAIIITLCTVPLIIFFLINHFENQKNNRLLYEKNKQVVGLFNVSSENWFNNIPGSPKMRVTEFMNISSELIEKKMILFGKGFAGTIKDNGGFFLDLSESSFSKWELELGAYYSVHESINSFFLIGGIFGLGILFSILFNLIKVIHKSPWLIIGFFWMLLFYNYHLTIAIYGITALIVGINESECENQNRIQKIELCK